MEAALTRMGSGVLLEKYFVDFYLFSQLYRIFSRVGDISKFVSIYEDSIRSKENLNPNNYISSALFAVGFNTPPLGAVDFCNAWNTW
jgi:hypothetical protein